MSSWSGVSLDGMPIFDSQNHYSEWYFRKSERVIESYRAEELYKNSPYEPGTIVKKYLYKMTAEKLRRRLDLDGYNYNTLEQEFNEQHQQLCFDIEEMLTLAPERISEFADTVRNSTLKDWIDCLKVIKQENKSLHPPISASRNEHNEKLLKFMLGVDLYFTNRPTAGDYEFPCKTHESYAVALLEITSSDAECVLDITELVDGGWTEAFDDLVEFHQEHTKFYEVFTTAIEDINEVSGLSTSNPTLARMLYAAVITALETYLSDTLKKQVINREAIKKKFVKSHDAFKEKKFTLSEFYEKQALMNDSIISEIDRISFHNLDRIPGLYKSVLSTTFPAEHLPELRNAITNRHDIVHRNGKNIQNKPLAVTSADVNELIQLVDTTVRYIDRQIKDGLLDDLDQAGD
ncbi:hypothetical protein BK669_19130 [Pseudomonas fluorescens]|nr:hypothetical protein BK669_19130 [Pseudomonas fluorescens]